MDDLTFATSNAFLHHGIQGQKWGVQNGPPYPLDKQTHSDIVKGKKQLQRKVGNTIARYTVPVYSMVKNEKEMYKAVKDATQSKGVGVAAVVADLGFTGGTAAAIYGIYDSYKNVSTASKEYKSSLEKGRQLLSKIDKDATYDDVKKVTKQVSKEYKKEEKQAKKASRADFNGDKVKDKSNSKKNREPYEFEKGSTTPNSKISPAERAAREEVRKAWEKANSDPNANNIVPIPRSALRKLAAAEIKNPEIHDENGKPYTSVDDYIKRNYGNDWGQYEVDTWEIVIG